MTSILFVDDQQPALDTLSDWFIKTRPDWQIHVALSAEKAIALIEQYQIDCIVSDMSLPGISGAALVSHVAQYQPDAVRIALSDSLDDELKLESLHATHRFINKPESPEKINTIIDRALSLRARLHEPALRSLITGITSLPVLPEIYDRLMLELASDSFSVGVVSRIIESDISLSATLLRIVNTPYYGLVQHVQSPKHAVNLLGIELVKNILLSEKVVTQFKQFNPDAKRISELNVQSSVRCVLANRFARLANLSKRQIDHCQIAGMLSALGELVVETRMIDPEVLADGPYDHNLIGSSILGLWSLPDIVVEAVLHQNDEIAPSGEISAVQVLHTIRILEDAFADNHFKLDEAFSKDTVFHDHPLTDELLFQWFDCFCDYNNDLKLAA